MFSSDEVSSLQVIPLWMAGRAVLVRWGPEMRLLFELDWKVSLQVVVSSLYQVPSAAAEVMKVSMPVEIEVAMVVTTLGMASRAVDCPGLWLLQFAQVEFP